MGEAFTLPFLPRTLTSLTSDVLCEVAFLQVENAAQQIIQMRCSSSRTESCFKVVWHLIRDALLGESVRVVVVAWTIMPDVLEARFIRIPKLYNLKTCHLG